VSEQNDPLSDSGGIPPDEVLPCGCLLRCAVIDGVNTLTVIPCRTTCRNYRNALGLADEKGLDVEYRRGT
jgi:hypothetical protein